MLIPFVFSAACSFFTGVILHDINNFKIRRYRLKAGGIKKNVRFVQLSDLHGVSFGKDNERLVKAVKKLHPDFIVMTGDMMSAKEFIKNDIPATVDTAESLIASLSMHFKVYYGMGNHEQRVSWSPGCYSFGYKEMLERFKKAGAVILDNSSVLREAEGIRISGLSMSLANYHKKQKCSLTLDDMYSFIGKPDDDHYEILIAHDPEYIDVYSKWGADLTLSGHYHGGIMQFPGSCGVISPRLELYPKYTGGHYHTGGHDQIVSRGLGTHTIPVRVFNPGEVVCVDLMA
ncbi:MAG: metallophosphoesterase [Lachnospiraceae bacterium]|nr:metallophosphoesterase [Lachnospiraceae bacterium]